MKLVDADAMKKDVEKQAVLLKIMFGDDEDMMTIITELYKGFMAQIDKMPTIDSEAMWTPVTEGMPKEKLGYDSRLIDKFPMVSSKCLVTVSEKKGGGIRFVDLCHTINGKWFSDTYNYFISENDWEVIAWKDASEPWKGGKN